MSNPSSDAEYDSPASNESDMAEKGGATRESEDQNHIDDDEAAPNWELRAYDWSDVEPVALPPSDESTFPVDYSRHYVLVFGRLLALLRRDEISPRALALCNLIIYNYQKNFTAWSFKFRILERLGFDYAAELALINNVLDDNAKSYQAWHYRQWLVDHCATAPDDMAGLVRILGRDAKNFHAWSYAVWYAQRWDKAHDIYLLAVSEIRLDCRNNSAWTVRRSTGDMMGVEPGAEFDDAAATLRIVGKNEAAVNFLIGMAVKQPALKPKVVALAEELAARVPDNPFAYRMMLWAAEERSEIERLCNRLMQIDQIRIPYYTLVKQGVIKYQ